MPVCSLEADRLLTQQVLVPFFVRVCRFAGDFSDANAGEMSTANPSSGSFATYAREALGPWAGYTIGWLYWFFWVIVIAVEAIAGSTIIQYWFPSLPSWGVSLLLTFLLTLTNLYSVKSFGEFEYWFSLIKVVSLVLFLLLGERSSSV